MCCHFYAIVNLGHIVAALSKIHAIAENLTFLIPQITPEFKMSGRF